MRCWRPAISDKTHKPTQIHLGLGAVWIEGCDGYDPLDNFDENWPGLRQVSRPMEVRSVASLTKHGSQDHLIYRRPSGRLDIQSLGRLELYRSHSTSQKCIIEARLPHAL